jgi:hypothetical protein
VEGWGRGGAFHYSQGPSELEKVRIAGEQSPQGEIIIQDNDTQE